jgi:hypothetical protein
MAWPIGSAFSVWVGDAQFTKRLNREEGITAGPSSGMNVAAGAAWPAHRNHASRDLHTAALPLTKAARSRPADAAATERVGSAAFKGIEDAPGNVVVVILCDPIWYARTLRASRPLLRHPAAAHSHLQRTHAVRACHSRRWPSLRAAERACACACAAVYGSGLGSARPAMPPIPVPVE